MSVLRLRQAPATTPPPSGGTYDLDSADLALIPWHGGSGAWGAQVPLEIAEEPSTSSNSTVSSLAAMQTALGSSAGTAVSNIRITLDTSVSDPSSTLNVWGNHVDIVIPTGVVGPCIYMRNGANNQHHIRIRGSSVLGTTGVSRSGGRVGQIRGGDTFFGENISHVIVDGVDTNGDTDLTNTEANQAFRLDNCDYVGIYRVNALAGGYTYIGGNRHVVIYESNFMAGALTDSELAALGYGSNGGVGKWALRHTGGGPITAIRSDFRNTHFHTMRFHPHGGSNELAALIDCRVVQYAEGKAIWGWAAETDIAKGMVIRGGEVWGYSGCGSAEDIQFTSGGTRTTDYGQIRDVATYSEGDADYTTTYLNGVGSALTTAGGTADVANNTATNPWPTSPTTGPAWDMNSTGDPTSLPLPDGTMSYGEASCTGGGTGWPYR